MVAVTDDFNRANNASLGANWTIFTGSGLSISSNTAVPPGLGVEHGNFYSGASFTSDQYAQAVLSGPISDRLAYLAVRVSLTGGQNGYWVEFGSFDNITIYKARLGTWTTLYSGTYGSSWSGTMRVEVVGSVIKVFDDGVQAVSVTDPSSVLSGGAPALSMRMDNAGSAWDDFAAGDLGAGNSQAPRSSAFLRMLMNN